MTSDVITIHKLNKMKQSGEKIAALTVYDAAFCKLLNNAKIDVLLVGDSLGMVIQGHSSTIPVTIEEMVYHTRCASRGNSRALLIGDMPFMSYSDPQSALKNAAKLMRAGAQMVKLEGGAWLLESVRQLVNCGIPVCGHLGLTPQSIHQLSGFHVQGRKSEQAKQILDDALALEKAGASLLVLECVPSSLAKLITEKLQIPTIGIGAGLDCSGQILVLHDMLGISEGRKFTFVKYFLTNETKTIQEAIENYVKEVKQGTFPGREHSFD